MYLLKYGNGWEMMPGDKRFPLRVAYNDEGTLEYENMHDGQRAWFENLAEEIHTIKKYGKSIENEYCKVWNAFTKKGKKKHSSSRSQNGEWILHNTREEVTITEKPHLITTTWHQGITGPLQFVEHYNMYCPIQSNGIYHKPAGCTPVAGGQVLLHLYKQGWSLSGIPNVAMPNSTMSEYTFTSPTTSLWGNVRNGSTDAIAKLLGHVGVLSHTTYTDNGSGAYLRNDLENAFVHYGVNCSILNSWDITKMKNNLNSNLPVIVSMTGRDNKKNKDVGHTVIVDGYKHINTRYTDVYIYVDNPDTYPGDIYDHEEGMDPVPGEGPTQEDTYTVESDYLYINWGYGAIDNTSYYVLHDLYYYYTDETTGNKYRVTFDREKRMLYNLSK